MTLLQQPATEASLDTEKCLEVARTIGDRLCDLAIWETDDTCTWEIITPERGTPHGRDSQVAMANGSVYQGTSGTGLFLGELHGVCGDERYRKTALGGVQYAIQKCLSSPHLAFGFHSGTVGIAYVLFRLHQIRPIKNVWQTIETLLKPMLGHENEDHGIDVIGGAAGSIPALLIMAQAAPDPDYLNQIAVGMGDHLINDARKESGGWSWGSPEGTSVRYLCGYAHGTAGCAHALQELFMATGQQKYLYAAEMALLYERRHYMAEEENWPDFRHSDMGEYTYNGQTAMLREVVRNGELKPYFLRSMSAWCHGAPGIGLSRLRAYELTGNTTYLEEALAALRTTQHSVKNQCHHSGNFSLCHGPAGNAVTLIYAADLLDAPVWLAEVHALARYGIENYHDLNKRFPAGTMGGLPDSSLMLGEAGTGLFYLHLVDSRIQSPLILRVPKPNSLTVKIADEAEDRARYVGLFFGQTLAALEHFGLSTPDLPPFTLIPKQTDVEWMAAQLANLTTENPALQDLFALERLRHDMVDELADLTDEFLTLMSRDVPSEIDWSVAEFQIGKHVQAIEMAYDWWNWLRSDRQQSPAQKTNYVGLFRQGGWIQFRPISIFTFLLLNLLKTPKTVQACVDEMADIFSAETPAHKQQLANKITQQLQQIYLPSFVRVANGAAAETSEKFTS